MTARIFAYIAHTDGVPDDYAAELLAAAKKLDPDASPVALVTGAGAELDTACDHLRSSYAEIWKVGSESLAYPNAELVRQALVKVLPPGSLVLIAHNHLGIDLAPGLSIQLNAAFVSDVVDIDGVECDSLKLVRQEFGGQVSTHVACDISSGAVLTMRPGAFQPLEDVTANGNVIDKSAQVGTLTAKRRYLTTVVAEAGDVDITKEPVLVSIGRGIQEQDNVAIAQELADAMGACPELFASGRRCQVAAEVASGWFLRTDRAAQGLPGLRHERIVPAPGRTEGQSIHRCHQQESQSSYFPGRRCRHRRRHSGVPAGIDRKSPRRQRRRRHPLKMRSSR